MIRKWVGSSFFRNSIVFLAILAVVTSAITTAILVVAPAQPALAACNTGQQSDCTTEEDCINTGNGDWVYKPVGVTARYVCQAQSSDPAQQCSASNLDKCTGQKGVACVKRANGVWQFQGGPTGQYKCIAGSTDPAQQCSPTNLTKCTSEPACKDQGQGTWQQKSGTSGTYECVAGGGGTGSTEPPADTDAIGDCGGGGLNWVICPVIQLAKAGAEKIDAFIMNSLQVDVTGIFETTCTGDNKTASDPSKTCTGKAYYTAWNSFRIIATAILVVAGLIMVISQALGFDFLDAYTIRKVLPRLVVAIIGMSLSWPLMKFVVEFFNILGNDIRSLIYMPFKAIGESGNIDLSVGIGSSLGILAGGLVLGGIGLLSFMATALLAVFVGFVIIVVRQIALVMLVVVAPVAIACYILPNTEKVWKLWKDNFLGLLLMFPIISGLIAAGHVFSAVALADNSGGTATGANLVGQIVGIVAYFLPYFLLPLTFRLATGVIGTIAGFANDRGRGVFDRLKKGRQTRMADRITRAQNGHLWDPNSRVGRIANKGASWATDPMGNAAYYGRNIPGFRKRGAKIASQIEHARIEQTQKAAESLNNYAGYNDKAYRAMNGALHEGLSEETRKKLDNAGLLGKNISSLKDFDTMSHILAGSGDQTERLASGALEGFRGTAATMFQDPEAARASLAGAAVMGLASHGFLDPHDLPNAANVLMGAEASTNGEGKITGYSAGHASERSFAQAIAGRAQVIAGRNRPDVKNGYALNWDSGSASYTNHLAEKHTKADGSVVMQNDSLRAIEELATLTADDIGGAKGGIYSREDKGIGDAMEYMLTATGDTAVAAQREVSDWSNEKKRAVKQSADASSADYQTLKLATAAENHDAFVQKMSQVIGPYSRASTDNTSRARQLLDSITIGGRSATSVVLGSDRPPTAGERDALARGGGDPGGPPPGMSGGPMGPTGGMSGGAL